MKTYKARWGAFLMFCAGGALARSPEDGWLAYVVLIGCVLGAWVGMNLIVDNIKDAKAVK